MAQTQTKTKTLWKVECDPACGFLIRDHDLDELAGFVVRHCKSAHDTTYSPHEARGFAKPA